MAVAGDRYDPWEWSNDRLIGWMGEFRRLQNLDRTKPCERKHYGCSIRENGPCSDGVLGAAEDRGLEDL